ncbi:hypothetical protein ACFL4W_01025 [Planctomycetota bacterium]
MKYFHMILLPFLLAAAGMAAQELVFEAEHINQVTYGWEIGEFNKAMTIYLKEGVGDGIGQKQGHFLGLHDDKRKLKGFYHIYIEKPGNYFLWARMTVNRGHCSNVFLVSIDGSDFKSIGQNWAKRHVWHWLLGPNYFLKKGWHTLVTRTHEDGISVDQFRLTTQKYNSGGNKPLQANYVPGRGPGIEKRELPPFEVLPRIATKIIRPESELKVDIWLRNNFQGSGKQTITLSIPEAMSEKTEIKLEFDVKKEDVCLKQEAVIPLKKDLPRREFCIKVSWAPQEGKTAVKELLFLHPFDWTFLGPLKAHQSFPHDFAVKEIDLEKKYPGRKGGTIAWKPFTNTGSFTKTGLVDFGLLYDKRMFDALPQAQVWGFTEIEIPQDGTYLLKILCDDRVRLWIGGRFIVEEYIHGPAIRYPRKKKIQLKKGVHKLVFNLNQIDDSWQLGLLFRTEKDGISLITGK